MARWLLVHPPLLGPAVLGPLGDVLRSRGRDVALPDLRSAVDRSAGWPGRWSDAAALMGPAETVLGFSGAGVTLPAVAVAVGAVRVVWLDALMPARSGETVADDDIRSRIPALLGPDGRIADWTTWWGPDALDELIPDAGLRAAVRAEGHRLPGDFYDVAVPVPERWPDEAPGTPALGGLRRCGGRGARTRLGSRRESRRRPPGRRHRPGRVADLLD